ncbi:MAG: hypothetical protein LBK42_01990 [Propionibacteriaceae bacterium]|jgi:hypothetical protein|nr:hypothetical protein [Propionibacteriaceae bacterium]
MAWWNGDDRLDDHPKWAALVEDGEPPAEAMALWLWVMPWAARNHTAGLVPLVVVRMKAREIRLADPDAAIQALIAVGLWDQTDQGIQVHDFTDWNPGSEDGGR